MRITGTAGERVTIFTNSNQNLYAQINFKQYEIHRIRKLEIDFNKDRINISFYGEENDFTCEVETIKA